MYGAGCWAGNSTKNCPVTIACSSSGNLDERFNILQKTQRIFIVCVLVLCTQVNMMFVMFL